MRLNRRVFLQTAFAAGAAMAETLQVEQTSMPALAASSAHMLDEDGYDLWLRYRPVTDAQLLAHYRAATSRIVQLASRPVAQAITDELERACGAMLGGRPTAASSVTANGTILIGTPDSSPELMNAIGATRLPALGDEAFVLKSVAIEDHAATVIAANHARGLLYGTFAFIKRMQLRQRLDALNIVEAPRANLRLVNHWDNIDRTVVRGYAGLSIFDFSDLTASNPRYEDYARILASVGINGTVINDVNASPLFLDSSMMPGYAALANILRRWGIRLYLAANFASPIHLTVDDPHPITTADPLDETVQAWWSAKVDEIYRAVPDFGGFLMKANSEGEPGPLTYNRTHAQGANMLARALKPHGGAVIWRSFVHHGFQTWDGFEYHTFHPLDGQFESNVVLQTKNGPIDFTVREPTNPLFGAMPRTNQMIELQITQEYTGHATHLCYLPAEWHEVLTFETHYKGTGPTVAEVVDGTADDQPLTGFAGVINFGDDRNWTGSFLAAANTHGFGRLAWDHALDVQEIATEWVQLTFGPEADVVSTIVPMLLSSWGTYQKYTSPFGDGYLVRPIGPHFEPDPRATQYLSHVTDSHGSGYDRTLATGTGFTRLYSDYWFHRYERLETCPEELMMFMHIVPWEHQLANRTTTIQQLYDDHFAGVDEVVAMARGWQSLKGRIDDLRFAAIAAQFDRQLLESRIWRDVLVSYYFENAQIVSTTNPWVQLEIEERPTLLFGGRTNEIPLRLTNATDQPQTLRVSIDHQSQAGWMATDVAKSLLPRESRVFPLAVKPPLEPYLGPVRFSGEPAGLATLGFDTQIMLVTPAAEFCTFAFDVGASPDNVLPGYRALTAGDIWNGVSRFGWVDEAPADAEIASGRDLLENDCATDVVPRTLRLRIPPGRQRAWVLIGGDWEGTTPIRVMLGRQILIESGYLPGDTSRWFEFALDGGAHGKTVDLTMAGADAARWSLTALLVLKPGL